VAVVFFCLSLTSSLLPHSWLFQAVAGGIVATTGYGLGVLAAWPVVLHDLTFPGSAANVDSSGDRARRGGGGRQQAGPRTPPAGP
jgi:uncharacterized membrane protein